MKKLTKARVLPKIQSLGDLRNQCNGPVGTADRYQRLAMIAAEDLGASPKNYKEALEELENQACALEIEIQDYGDDGEGTIVDEINFVRDIEAEEFLTKRK